MVLMWDVSSGQQVRIYWQASTQHFMSGERTNSWLLLVIWIVICSADELLSHAQVSTLRGHTDYVRSAASSPASADVWATGG